MFDKETQVIIYMEDGIKLFQKGLRQITKYFGSSIGKQSTISQCSSHSRLTAKSSQSHKAKKLHQLSRVDFCLPMGIESLWFRYRDLFPELIFRYRPICAAKNEVIRICHFLT